MTPVAILWLGVQGVAFAVWAVLMFRTLFRLRARAVARSGRAVPGLSATLEAFGAFLHLPEYRDDRRALGAATGLMFVLIALTSALMPLAAP